MIYNLPNTNGVIVVFPKEEYLKVKHLNIVHAAVCYEEIVAAASKVMQLLEEHGAGIVPHLLDTDDNVGQRLREILEKAGNNRKGMP